MKLNDKERDAVLAGLRLLQREIEGPNAGDWFGKDIYTNDGDHEGLTPAEIDDLCERLNQ